MCVLCMYTARVTVSVRIRVSVRKLGFTFITRLADMLILHRYELMHTASRVLCIASFTITA